MLDRARLIRTKLPRCNAGPSLERTTEGRFGSVADCLRDVCDGAFRSDQKLGRSLHAKREEVRDHALTDAFTKTLREHAPRKADRASDRVERQGLVQTVVDERERVRHVGIADRFQPSRRRMRHALDIAADHLREQDIRGALGDGLISRPRCLKLGQQRVDRRADVRALAFAGSCAEAKQAG